MAAHNGFWENEMQTTPRIKNFTLPVGVLKVWKIKQWLPLYGMILPALIGLIIFSYWPMYGVLIAFKNFKPLMGFDDSPWVGFYYFTRLFNTPSIWLIFRNTLVIAVAKIIFGQLASLILALMLHEVVSRRFKNIIQQSTYLLNFFSWVIFGGIMLDILLRDGLVNQGIALLGLPKINFLTDPAVFPFTMVITDIWKSFGFGAVVFLAALTGVDPTLYEAAVVDGANRWDKMVYITLPSIAPIIVLLACLSLGNVLNAGFEQILFLQNPQVLSSGEIIDTFVYKTGLVNQQYSFGTAVGLLKSVVSMVLILLSYYLADRFANYRIF
jgi:putative aldouronate transport system permease protein